MIERITVELTPDELAALYSAAIIAHLGPRFMGEIAEDLRPHLPSALKALRGAEGRRLTDDALIYDLNIKGTAE